MSPVEVLVQQPPSAVTQLFEMVPVSVQVLVGGAVLFGAAWKWVIDPRMASRAADNREGLRKELSEDIDKKFDAQSAKFDAQSAKFDALSKEVGALSKEVGVLSERSASQSKKIDELSEKVDANSKKLGSLSEKLGGQSEKLAAQSEKLASHSEKLASQSKKIDALSKKVDDNTAVLSKEIAGVKQDTDKVAGAVGVLTRLVQRTDGPAYSTVVREAADRPEGAG